MRDNNTVVITRGLLGQFASFTAAGVLLIGVLATIWNGGITTAIGIIFGLSAAALVAWIVLSPQEFFGFITGRQARRSTVAVFSTLLLLGIVVLVFIIIEREVITFDMTNAGDFSLSASTERVIAEVNRPIRITGFYSPELVASQDLDDSIFRLYTSESDGLITRQYIDPVANPEIAETFGVQEDGDVFLSYLNDDGTVDESTIQFVPRVGKQERDMTQGIARLLASGQFTVYFTTGHGELSAADGSVGSLSLANGLLVQNGFTTFTLDLKALVEDGDSIPQDASALIIARPREQFTQPVIDMLDEYLQDGGALFIMADAIASEAPFLAQESAFNTYLWENWGIRMLDAVVIEEGIEDAPSPLDIIAFAVSTSPVTANIEPESDPDSVPLFHIARAIEVDPEPPVNNGNLIRTSEISYGETDIATVLQTNTFEVDSDTDFRGPLTVAAFAFRADDSGATRGQIILVGDSDFVTDGRIGQPTGNAFLFLDGLGWLTRFAEQISIAPEAVGVNQPLIFVDPSRLDQIAFITLVLLPGALLLTGFGVWFVRSRR